MFATDYLFYIIIVLVAVYFIGTINHDHFKKRGVKFMKPIPFFGNYGPIFLQNKHLMYIVNRLWDKFSTEKYIGFFSFNMPWICVPDNEIIKLIGVKEAESFMDHSHPLVDKYDPLYSNILVALRGEKWKEMRAMVTPAFTSSKIKHMFPFIKECSDQLVNYVNKEINDRYGGICEINVKDLFARFATDVIASIAFGLKIDSFKDKQNKFLIMGRKLTDMNIRFMIIYTINILFPKVSEFFGLTLIDKESAKYFQEIILKTIKEREEMGIKRLDMIDLLVDAKRGCLKGDEKNGLHDNNGNKVKKIWTDDELTGQALMFFMAGYETVSTALAYISYELCLNPDLQQRLFEEIDQVSEEEISMERITELKYLDMIVSESLRKHPSVPAMDRVCTKPYTLPPPNAESKQGYQMNVGDVAVFHYRAIMRDPRYFPNPEKFDPERFSEENKHKILPNTYIPFGVGPRQCLGKRLSYMELKTVVFFVISKFELFAGPNLKDPLKQTLRPTSMMPVEGIHIGFRKRKQNT